MRVNSRRSFLKAVAISLSYPSFASICFAKSSLLSDIGEQKEIDFDGFIALSRFLTQVHDLNDTAESRKIYKLLMEEPWGPENLKRVYGRIRELQKSSGNSNKSILHKSNFSSDNQWFISHLLLTWYTGVYFHDMGNHNVTLKHALMYKKISGFRAPPTYCAGAPGYWDVPPVNLREKHRLSDDR